MRHSDAETTRPATLPSVRSMRLATTAEGETDLGDWFDIGALIDLRRGLARHAGLID